MHKTTHPCGGTYPPQPQILLKNDIVFPPTLHPHLRHDPPPGMVTSAAVSAASSWLRHRRIRYIFLLLCSPLLLVLLCTAFPFLCAAELCLRRRFWRKLLRGDDAGDRLRRCEEGCSGGREEEEEERGLLHRYLEDQLLLVGSMYECGDDDEEHEEEQEQKQKQEDSRKVEDVLRLGSTSSRTPLLR